MAIVPYPKTVRPVKLRHPQAGFRFAGQLMLGLSALLALGAVAVAEGPAVLDRLTPDRAAVTDQTSPSVLGAREPSGAIADQLSGLVVAAQDLPAALAAYHRDDVDAGVTAQPLGGANVVSGYRATFVGTEPFDLFTTSTGLFATAEQAARAYVAAAQPSTLAQLTGQEVRVTGVVEAGAAGVVFRGSGAEDGRRIFAGALVIGDRLTHFVFGYVPAVVTDADLGALASAPLARYADAADVSFGDRRDKDGDGLTAALETALGTDPAKRDTDGDGFADSIEVAGGYDPLGDGRAVKSDGLFVIPGITE